METPAGIFGRLAERVLGWIALALLLAAGWAIYQMPGATKAAIWSGLWRTVVWFGVAAAIPWSGRLFMRRVLEIGSNWAGLALLAALTAADLVAALVLMTGWPTGGWAWAAALLALAAAGTYNYLVTEYLAEAAGR